MSVDSHSTTIVFCEGEEDSLDSLLLKSILPVGRVRIRPIGGKHSLPAYIRGYVGAANRQVSPNYIAFRDRDFDQEPTSITPTLLQLRTGQPIYLGHRATIENYLIDVDLIFEYWVQRQNAPRWQHGPAKPKEEIARAIHEAALELLDYQAVRWALSKLKPGYRWPEIQTSWVKRGSGNLPHSLEFSSCIAEAVKLVEQFHSDIQGINSDILEHYAEEFRQRFHSKDFLDSQAYLVWFQGKDIMKSLCSRLSPNFPRRNFEEWAAQHVDAKKHPDLHELISLIP